MTVVRRELPNGYVVDLFPHTEGIVEEIWSRRCYDVPIEPGDLVLDLGANQGIFSLYAAAQGARVVAVEPDQANFDRLLDNVERNGLSTRITAYRAAIADRDGTVDLFVPETGVYGDSGLITTQDAIRRAYAELAPRSVRAVAVPALTLEALLGRVGPGRIAVLKIDCEGAELSILRSAGPAGHARVRHLVMETHDAYPERDLFFAVREFGYQVVAYRKRARDVVAAFATGYLSATRAPASGAVFDGVVAVLGAPRVARADRPLAATAEGSFSAASPRAALEFRWSLDGRPLGGGHAIHFTPGAPGDHLLEVAVADPATGRTDAVRHHLWALSRERGPGPERVEPLKNPGERLRTRFGPGDAWYGVLGDRLSAHHRSGLWRPDLLSLEVTLLAGGVDPGEAIVRLDDRLVRLERAYTRIDVRHFPLGEDLLFRIEASRPLDAELRWFPEVAGEERRLEGGSTDRHELQEPSRTYVCPLAGATGFLIPARVMPADWTPRCVKIGLSVHPSDAVGGELEGEARLDGRSWSLAGGYQEVVLPDPPAFMGGVSFEVMVDRPRTYKLVWWWE